MDYVDFVVHIFSPEKREYYGLERLRKSAKLVSMTELDAELNNRVKAARIATPAPAATPAAVTAPAKKGRKEEGCREKDCSKEAAKTPAKKAVAKKAVRKSAAKKKPAAKKPVKKTAQKSKTVAKKTATKKLVKNPRQEAGSRRLLRNEKSRRQKICKEAAKESRKEKEEVAGNSAFKIRFVLDPWQSVLLSVQSMLSFCLCSECLYEIISRRHPPQRSRAKKAELDAPARRLRRAHHPLLSLRDALLRLRAGALRLRPEKSSARTPSTSSCSTALGKQLTSEAFAAHLGKLRDAGTQQILFAIGPANGWSAESRKKTQLLLSLGPMTLPHELARVVLAEQIYRACTILAGHPYHSGH